MRRTSVHYVNVESLSQYLRGGCQYGGGQYGGGQCGGSLSQYVHGGSHVVDGAQNIQSLPWCCWSLLSRSVFRFNLQ